VTARGAGHLGPASTGDRYRLRSRVTPPSYALVERPGDPDEEGSTRTERENEHRSRTAEEGVGLRFLHTSDWQLGMTRHYLDAEAQGRFTRARFDAVARLAELATDRGCEFVVVAGDVFETNQPDAATVARALEALGRFDVPVHLLPGNHDCFDPGSVYRSRAFLDRRPDHVEVLGDGEARPVADGVELVAAPWYSKRPLTDLVGEACGRLEADGTRRIVVGHGAVDEVSGTFDDPRVIRLADVEDALEAGCVHYVALGDRHSCTDVGRTGRVWYAGVPEPTDYDELDAGTALVVDLADDGEVKVDRIDLGTWRFALLDLGVDGDEDLDELERRLGGFDDPARTIVKLKLTGTLTLRQADRLERLLEHHTHVLGALEHPERHRDIAVLPEVGDLAELPLHGYAATARDRLVDRARGGDATAGTATDALGLLLRLAGSGSGR
jgi:DNA repair exonuclease SbcCD nuclease subunit